MPAGGLAPDGRSWVSCRPGFFLPVRVLSRLFRGRFLAALREAYRSGKLQPQGALTPAAFGRLLDEASRTDWVVYAKPPFDGPRPVLAYLARYTHRTAISNHRILDLDDDSVTFRYTDYRSRRPRRLTLSIHEFSRRFLLHVLPTAFVRIRYYGFLAHGCRSRLLPLCRAALEQPPSPPAPASTESVAASELLGELLAGLLPKHLRLCPVCRKAPLRIVHVLQRPPPFGSMSYAAL